MAETKSTDGGGGACVATKAVRTRADSPSAFEAKTWTCNDDNTCHLETPLERLIRLRARGGGGIDDYNDDEEDDGYYDDDDDDEGEDDDADVKRRDTESASFAGSVSSLLGDTSDRVYAMIDLFRNMNAFMRLSDESTEHSEITTALLDSMSRAFPSLAERPETIHIDHSQMQVPLNAPVSLDYAIRNIRPLDLFAVKSVTTLGNLINILQSKFRSSHAPFCSHTGVFVTKDVLPSSNMKRGTLYILESVIVGTTSSAPSSANGEVAAAAATTTAAAPPLPVYDIDGKDINGVQIREFLPMMEMLRTDGTSIVMWGKLNGPSRAAASRAIYGCPSLALSALRQYEDGATTEETRGTRSGGGIARRCTCCCTTPHDSQSFITSLLGTPYPSKPGNFMSSILPPELIHRKFVNEPGETYFCSEMVAALYGELDILDPSLYDNNPRNVFPVDFGGDIGAACLESLQIVQFK